MLILSMPSYINTITHLKMKLLHNVDTLPNLLVVWVSFKLSL
jgi:hypothetical protein